MHCVIRVDASLIMGTGHVMRCLTLAEELKKNENLSIHFVSRLHDGNLCKLIEQCGFFMHRLPEPSQSFVTADTLAHAEWLGVHWQQDADETLAVIESLHSKPIWLVVDHYGLDSRWEGYLRSSIQQILVIDDLADRSHNCDILLDQNMIENQDIRYVALVNDSCRLLLGPRYALLQMIYSELHKQVVLREGQIKRILIYFGGADRGNFTGISLQAFLNIEREDLEVDVVIGCVCPHEQAIRDFVRGKENIHIHRNLPSLAPLMLKADLAIGAAGTTSWERFCMGLPTLGLSLADNQKPIAEFLHKKDLLYWLGHGKDVDCERLTKRLREVVSQGLKQRWSQVCYEAVDGKGGRRVVDSMFISASGTPLTVRRAAASDEVLLLEWANDPETRRNSFSNKVITSDEHHAWFHKQLGDVKRCCFFIIEDPEKNSIGQVRFEREHKRKFSVSYSLSKGCRGKDMGRRMLEVALEKFLTNRKKIIIVARVKRDNIPSQKIFQKLNFFLNKKSINPDFLEYAFMA